MRDSKTYRITISFSRYFAELFRFQGHQLCAARGGASGVGAGIVAVAFSFVGCVLFRIKVELVPPPVSVSHRWDRENGLVVHLFELSADASTIDDYQLQLTRFDHLAAEAWTSREPVTVEIGASDNLLRLDASNTSP